MLPPSRQMLIVAAVAAAGWLAAPGQAAHFVRTGNGPTANWEKPENWGGGASPNNASDIVTIGDAASDESVPIPIGSEGESTTVDDWGNPLSAVNMDGSLLGPGNQVINLYGKDRTIGSITFDSNVTSGWTILPNRARGPRAAINLAANGSITYKQGGDRLRNQTIASDLHLIGDAELRSENLVDLADLDNSVSAGMLVVSGRLSGTGNLSINGTKTATASTRVLISNPENAGPGGYRGNVTINGGSVTIGAPILNPDPIDPDYSHYLYPWLANWHEPDDVWYTSGPPARGFGSGVVTFNAGEWRDMQSTDASFVINGQIDFVDSGAYPLLFGSIVVNPQKRLTLKCAGDPAILEITPGNPTFLSGSLEGAGDVEITGPGSDFWIFGEADTGLTGTMWVKDRTVHFSRLPGRLAVKGPLHISAGGEVDLEVGEDVVAMANRRLPFGMIDDPGTVGTRESSNQIAETSIVTIDPGGRLKMQGCNARIGGLMGDPAAGGSPGRVSNSGSGLSTLTINVAAGPAPHFAGTLEDGEGGDALALVKAGEGTQVLSGANTYTGGTTVRLGTLDVAGAGALPPGGSLAIEAGGTVVLASGLSVAGASRPSQAATVPEPGSLGLLAALAGFGLWFLQRGKMPRLHGQRRVRSGGARCC